MPSMIPMEIRNSVRVLKAQGQTLREISRLLKLSRNAVRRILREREVAAVLPCPAPTLAKLDDVFARAGGNVARVQQLLAAETDLQVPYSTLTRWIREAGLRSPPRRAGEYSFAPGEEMQHDTSPHRMMMAGKAITAPEMHAFARTLGFGFRAHRVGHPDRKGRIERPFAYVEGNFLPARSFDDFADLNRQALAWCRDVANQKQKRVLGMSPEAAYLIEKPHLQTLPGALPPVYDVLERVVDLHGYVSIDTNRYSVPERVVGLSVTVYKYPADIRICRRGSEIATHPRLIGQRDARHTLPEHHPTPARASRTPALEEKLLRGDHESLARYAAALKQRTHGGGLRALRRLLEMKRTYPAGPFLAAVEQALHFGMFDLARLETLVLRQVAGDFFDLDTAGDDDA